MTQHVYEHLSGTMHDMLQTVEGARKYIFCSRLDLKRYNEETNYGIHGDTAQVTVIIEVNIELHEGKEPSEARLA